MSAAAGERRRKFWGWGYEGAGPSPEQCASALETLSKRYGRALSAVDPPREDQEGFRLKSEAARADAPLTVTTGSQR